MHIWKKINKSNDFACNILGHDYNKIYLKREFVGPSGGASWMAV
jgi:hypothetical protein